MARNIIAPPPAIPTLLLEPGDRVGYALSTGFDPARRGTVESAPIGALAGLVGVRWDGSASTVLVQRATLAKAGELTRAWSRC